MKLLNGTVAAAHLDVVDAIDFLATVQRKERLVCYHQNDYLRSKRKIFRSNDISYDDNNMVQSTHSFYQNLQKLGQWEMSMEGRIQEIGRAHV